MADGPDGVRVAELVATLSYAADLGLGQPMEHCMRQTVIALRLADLMGTGARDRSATYYLGLLMNSFCHADAAEQASWFGDDIAFKGDGFDAFAMGAPQMISFLIRKLSSHGSGLSRARRVAAFSVVGQREIARFLTTHSTLGAQFAERVGLGAPVADALRQGYEQWDGKGQPRHLRGGDIARPALLVQFAGPMEVYTCTRGTEAARAIARRHRGTQFAPDVVDAFCDNVDTVLSGLDEAADWDAILEAAPELSRRVDGDELDTVLEAMADLVDVKSPRFAGHSRGVASLAAEAAYQQGLPADDVRTLRRAGLIHDLGRLGVPNSIMDKPGPLTKAEYERVRLQPYLTDRMIARVTGLGRSREIATRHHERLDGSGYPRGLTAASLTPLDRLLAAADVCHALGEPRAYRAAVDAAGTVKVLLGEVTGGRLDGDAVNAVLKAAGHRADTRRTWPGGLTAREVEVLALVARGHSNKEIARLLHVAPKTVSNHIEHVYTKLSVTSRAAATMYAMRHGLVGAYEPAS